MDLVLIIAGVILIAIGAFVISGAETIMQEMAALLFWIIAAVAFVGGFVIHYIRQGTAKLLAAVQAQGITASTSPAPAALQRYRVRGIDRESGLETDLVLEATDKTDAAHRGAGRGMNVKAVELA